MVPTECNTNFCFKVLSLFIDYGHYLVYQYGYKLQSVAMAVLNVQRIIFSFIHFCLNDCMHGKIKGCVY